MQKKLRFALFGNEFQAKNSSTIQKVSHTLSALGGEVVVEPSCDEDFHADFAISIGGDGTFLKTASLVGTKGIPASRSTLSLVCRPRVCRRISFLSR